MRHKDTHKDLYCFAALSDCVSLCGKAARTKTVAAQAHVQKQLRHSHNEKCIQKYTLIQLN